MKTSLQIPLVHSDHKPTDSEFIPYWARCQTQFAQNLLELSPEPIEYDFHDDDGWENCFFFPEDCTRAPVLELESYESDSADENSIDASDKASLSSVSDAEPDSPDNMTPALPDIRMLDTEALSDLLEDNLCPPEITSILIFATNGAIFAYASDLSTRQLRNLSATYGAAYTSFARTASTGNLTGVKHASQPSSYMTAPSVSLGDVGSIVFENENQVAVVTKIADKVLLAAVGPEKLQTSDLPPHIADASVSQEPTAAAVPEETTQVTPQEFSQATRPTTVSSSSVASGAQHNGDGLLAKQYEIDREHDLARLAALNLNTSPEILLALESKSAALGRFLRQKLQDLESPEDF